MCSIYCIGLCNFSVSSQFSVDIMGKSFCYTGMADLVLTCQTAAVGGLIVCECVCESVCHHIARRMMNG